MNVVYAKTAAGPVIMYYRPDQDYADLSGIEDNLNLEAARCGTTVIAYAIADRGVVVAECPTGEEINAKLGVALKSEVPSEGTIVPPTGVLLGDIPLDAYVAYLI